MGHVRRTEGGRWQARYRDPAGDERGRTFDRRSDAERFLAVVEADKLRGEWIDPRAGKVTVGEFAERWFATTGALKPKTRNGYRSLLDSRILPRFAAQEMRRVDPISIREWVAELQGGGLSASRIRQARNVLHAIFALAVEASVVARNPASAVKTPRVVSRERRYLTGAQVEALASAITPPYDVLVYVLAYAGIRFGEAAALRRERCDLLRSRLRITESLAEVAGELHFGTTKTHRQRTVVVPATVRDLLAQHLISVPDRPNALVFTSPSGRALRYANFRTRVWRPAVEAAGLGDLGVHELRHTAASLMINQGADPKLIQTQLGHSSISVTFDVYGHLMPDRLDEIAGRLDDVLKQARAPRQPRMDSEPAVRPLTKRA